LSVTRAIRTLEERPSIFITNKVIFSSERVLYKTMIAWDQLKKSLVVSPKGLGDKTNCLTVHCRS
jgi:hypothetical protein